MKKTLAILLLFISLNLFAETKMVIQDNGVGDIKLGQVLPKEFRVNYFKGMYADFLDYEGYLLKDLGLKIAVTSKKSNRVKFLVIDSDKIKTAEGLGIGSTLNDIKRVYPSYSANEVPPTFGNDEYAVMGKADSSVVFYFKDKKSFIGGSAVTRVMIFK
jgi:hypothetical protein